MDVILAIPLPSLMWLTLGRGHIISYPYAQFGFISTLATIIYMLNTGTQKNIQPTNQQSQPKMAPGFTLTLLLLTPVFLLDLQWSNILPTLLISPILAWVYYHWRGNMMSPSIFHWIKLSVLALIGSTISQLIILP